MLWGLEAIKTRGESVAILLALVGARPVKEATGRVVKYELIPLEELGRPRIDVLASLSGTSPATKPSPAPDHRFTAALLLLLTSPHLCLSTNRHLPRLVRQRGGPA